MMGCLCSDDSTPCSWQQYMHVATSGATAAGGVMRSIWARSQKDALGSVAKRAQVKKALPGCKSQDFSCQSKEKSYRALLAEGGLCCLGKS